jgi:diguanylate cyclase (GGDEF)-like protein
VVSIVIANGLLSGVFAMFAEGLYQFQRRAPPRWLIWLPVAAVTVSFMFLLHDLHARIVLSGIIFSLQCLILLLALFEKRRETVGRGQYFLAAGLELALAIFLLRAVVTATGMVETLSMAASSTVQAATYLSSLVGVVLLSLGFVLMTKERTDERNQILAIQDELTGLANRRRLNVILAKEWARVSRTRQTLALVMLDVDQFKDYNDRYGHQAGDECLRRVARVLQASAQRAGDLAARYGGEEFLLVLANTDTTAAMRVAESVRQAVESLAIAHAQTSAGKVTVSAGVAVLTNASYANAESLLRAADDALYLAKAGGRNQVQLAP